MSDDPKDPRWRLRLVESFEEKGYLELLEEELVSANAETAQPTDVRTSLIATRPQAEWLYQVLGEALRLAPSTQASAVAPDGAQGAEEDQTDIASFLDDAFPGHGYRARSSP